MIPRFTGSFPRHLNGGRLGWSAVAIPASALAAAVSLVILACPIGAASSRSSKHPAAAPPALPPPVVRPMPRLVRTAHGVRLLLDDKPYLILHGEADNSSGSSLQFLENHTWKKLESVNANTALIPIYWELVEPTEWHFDFSLIDGIIRQARDHRMHVVFLWFGAYKNTNGSYAPAWVKTNLGRFPRAQMQAGENSTALSAFGPETCKADARAFATVMRHIGQVDSQNRTVLMMQVESEAGGRGGNRDHCLDAEAAFQGSVPRELMRYLTAHQAFMTSDFAHSWNPTAVNGTWGDVFGDQADNAFTAWFLAHYVDRVAAAGMAEYPIPMYTNAWNSNGFNPDSLLIWRAAAPHIDVVGVDCNGAPADFQRTLAGYQQSDRALLIPESQIRWAPTNAFTALAGFGAIGFGTYPIEDEMDHSASREVYTLFRNAMSLFTRYQGSDQLVAVLQTGKDPQAFDLGAYHIHVDFIANSELKGDEQPGHGFILALGDREFLVAGSGFKLQFLPRPGDPPHVDILYQVEGHFDANGAWVSDRRLNGDESGINFGSTVPGLPKEARTLHVRKIRLFNYR